MQYPIVLRKGDIFKLNGEPISVHRFIWFEDEGAILAWVRIALAKTQSQTRGQAGEPVQATSAVCRAGASISQ